MVMKQLLGALSPQQFLDDYFLRLPFSLPGAAADLTSLGTWETLRRILESPSADVMVVKSGERWSENRLPSFQEAQELHQAGYTILVRHAERQDPELQKLAEGFAEDFQAVVDVHMYVTPAENFGFGWHYDAEDVFILQTQGEKEYSLRKNTVNPWPIIETLPQDMRYEREIMPMMRCLLKQGDWLYIPNGYWHMAKAPQPSISLAVGVMPPTSLDLFDSLREQLLPSMLWRQRLPITGKASSRTPQELLEDYRPILDQLRADLEDLLSSEMFLRSYLESQGLNFPEEPFPTV